MTRKFTLYNITLALPKRMISSVRERLKNESLDNQIDVVEKRCQKYESFITYESVKNKDGSTSFILRCRQACYKTDRIVEAFILELVKEGVDYLDYYKGHGEYDAAKKYLNPNA